MLISSSVPVLVAVVCWCAACLYTFLHPLAMPIDPELSSFINFKFEQMHTALLAEVTKMRNDFSQFKELTEAKDIKVAELESEVARLKECVQANERVISSQGDEILQLKNSVDEEDAYVRRESLIFSGSMVQRPSSETSREDCVTFIRNKIREKMNIEVNASEISVSHRLGARSASQGLDKRPIVARFTRRDIKRDILFTKRDNRNPASTLYVAESLTPRRRSIHYALRQMYKKHPDKFTGYSTLEGKVYAYTKTPRSLAKSRKFDQKHVVNTMESLQNFCREFIKKPLDDFLDAMQH